MNKSLLFLTFLCCQLIGHAQATIRGIATSYANQKIAIYKLDDYISNHETLVTESSINAKGYFIFSVSVPSIEKYIIRVKDAYAEIYLQDKAYYTLELPEIDPSLPRNYSNSEMEITFIDLDSSDINYKILGFQAWMDSYLSEIYYTNKSDHGDFIRKIRFFKDEVERVYTNDTSLFFREFLRYSIGQSIDNLQYLGAPSGADKFDFYFKEQAILYHNDAYMTYFNGFFKKFLFQINGAKANDLYVNIARGDLQKTDSLLSLDRYLNDANLRQLVLLNILKEEYYGSYLPKSGVLKLLSQLANHGTTENTQIAKNLLRTFNTAAVGFRFPELILRSKNDSTLLSSIKGKYIYLHAFDVKNTNCIAEIAALKKLHEKYGKEIEFVSIYPTTAEPFSKVEERNLASISWKTSTYSASDPTWKRLQLVSFPYYLLIDDSYYLLASPALSPLPNGNYQTIEKTLYDIVHQNDKE